MSSGSSSSKSWAQITAETGSELHFIEDSRSVVIDGVLQIPHSVIDLGIQRLESAIVAQFVGAPPPLKVVSAMLNRLWSLELKPIWIKFKEVPPELLTPEGVSWLATQLGKPVNKLVRNGFSVKVCVLRKDSDARISELR
ncbi:hypothetical protein LINPERPRIM_LOCUS37845, partial [Linum perenne]